MDEIVRRAIAFDHCWLTKPAAQKPGLFARTIFRHRGQCYSVQNYTITLPMLPHLTQQDVASALDDVAAELLAAANVIAPPVDAIALAGRLAMTIAVDDQQQGRA